MPLILPREAHQLWLFGDPDEAARSASLISARHPSLPSRATVAMFDASEIDYQQSRFDRKRFVFGSDDRVTQIVD